MCIVLRRVSSFIPGTMSKRPTGECCAVVALFENGKINSSPSGANEKKSQHLVVGHIIDIKILQFGADRASMTNSKLPSPQN